MSEQISSKLYEFENSDGNHEKLRVSESKLIFADEQGELLPGCIYKPEDFADFLSGKKKFSEGYVFFKTAEISDKNGNKGSITIERVNVPGYAIYAKIRFNELQDVIAIAKCEVLNEKNLDLSKFLNYGKLKDMGFGHDLMSLIKTNTKNNIYVESSDEAIGFYLKEGFEALREYPSMIWAPKTSITPELRRALNDEVKKARDSLK